MGLGLGFGIGVGLGLGFRLVACGHATARKTLTRRYLPHISAISPLYLLRPRDGTEDSEEEACAHLARVRDRVTLRAWARVRVRVRARDRARDRDR